VHRIGENKSRQAKLTVYVLAGTASGALAGAVLGWIGTLLAPDARAGIATLLGVLAIVVATLELLGHRVPLLQRDKETPRDWLTAGPLLWAMRNGASLGFGARSRLGFSLWYVIPVGALLSGRPLVGALGYGLYGLTRTIGAGGLVALQNRNAEVSIFSRVLALSARARAIASVQLVVVGVVTVAVAGL
jgi:hypothetical protein